MLFSQAQRAAVRDVERHWKSNLWIRCIILVLDATCIAIIATEGLPFTSLWFTYIALCPSIAWTLAVISFRLCRTLPIHPGVHVGFDLCLWVTMLPVGIFDLMYTMMWRPIDTLLVSLASVSPESRTYVANLVGGVLMILLSILHFYLFVRACIDTERRRMTGITQQAASMAAQIVKNMESRGTFYRRDSQGSYVYSPSEQGGHILGLDELHLAERGRPIHREDELNDRGFARDIPSDTHGPESSRMSQHSYARNGRDTRFSQARTQYSHTRSMSVPVPTSPMSLRTARTDEPSLYELSR